MPKKTRMNEGRKDGSFGSYGPSNGKGKGFGYEPKGGKGMVTRTRVATRGKAEIRGKEAAKASARAALMALVITKKRPPRLLGL